VSYDGYNKNKEPQENEDSLWNVEELQVSSDGYELMAMAKYCKQNPLGGLKVYKRGECDSEEEEDDIDLFAIDG
jgi:hypothetical protein